jgi:hypothetical protein
MTASYAETLGISSRRGAGRGRPTSFLVDELLVDDAALAIGIVKSILIGKLNDYKISRSQNSKVATKPNCVPASKL